MNWAIGMDRRYEVRGQEIRDIFSELEGYEDKGRFQLIYEQCQKAGWC